jgi:acetyl-CoA acetyltransferase
MYDQVAIILDSEVSRFGIHGAHGPLECAARTVASLLNRYRTTDLRIGLVVAGASRIALPAGRENGLSQSIQLLAGMEPVPGLDVRGFCATGNIAIHEAVRAVRSGRCEAAIAVGVDHASQVTVPIIPESAQSEGLRGFSPVVFYALVADRYRQAYQCDSEVFAEVVVANRSRGRLNPNARFRRAVTTEEVLKSRRICGDLTLLQCAASSDGSGAALIVSPECLRRLRSDEPGYVAVVGLGEASADDPPDDLISFAEERRASVAAYEEASAGPEEIKVAEIHDAFSISEIVHIEDVGLAAPGTGWQLAADPACPVVINPSGGLLSRGHPMAATGIAQFQSVAQVMSQSVRSASPIRRTGLIQESGGIQAIGQMLSTCAVLRWVDRKEFRS